MRAAVAATATLLAALACGCAGEEVGGGGDPLFRAGGAALDGSGFVELPDGVDVELIPGAQGGFHVWVNVSVQGMTGELLVEREARQADDGDLILHAITQAIDVPESAMEGWWSNAQASPAFMCPTPIGVPVVDQEVRIQVRLLSPEQEEVGADTLLVVPRCPTGDQAEFCREICSG